MSFSKTLTTYSNGTYGISVLDDPPVMPEPQPEPQTGVRAHPGDTFLVVIHDNLNPEWNYQARTWVNKSGLRQTNEMYVPREWRLREDGAMGIRRTGQIKYWPERLLFGWYDYFHSQMTAKQKELEEGRNFGWRDGQEGQLNVFKMVVCGGQLFKKIGRWNEFSLIVTQDTSVPPSPSTHHDAPHLWVKQGICGHSVQTGANHYGKVNPAIGDLYIPVATAGGIAGILNSETREYPQVPFWTRIDGYIARIDELCFRGAEVLGLASDGNWYYLLEQVTQNGNQADFVVHSPDVPPSLPVPVVGWRKE